MVTNMISMKSRKSYLTKELLIWHEFVTRIYFTIGQKQAIGQKQLDALWESNDFPFVFSIIQSDVFFVMYLSMFQFENGLNLD